MDSLLTLDKSLLEERDSLEDLDLTFPLSSLHISQQAYHARESHSPYAVFPAQYVPGEASVTTAQGDAYRIFDCLHTSHMVKPLDVTESVPTNPAIPAFRTRKRKAPTICAEAWEPYKARILDLHVAQKLPLRDVKTTIEAEFGFLAELRQYRTRITQWGQDKNIKTDEMKAIVRKQQYRKLVEDKRELKFTVRGSSVGSEKIVRWMKRNAVPDSLLYVPSPAAATPSAVSCRTISEINSPIHSPSYMIGSPNPSTSGNTPIAHDLQIQSPTISISHTLGSQDSRFQMPNPLEFYQSFTNIASRLAPSSYAAPDLPKVTEEVQEDRCRRLDEDCLREELQTARHLYGPSHPKSLNVLYQLGVVLLHQGRYQLAVTVASTLVENCSMIGGREDPSTLKAEHLLGQIYVAQGHYGQAEELFRRISDCRKSALGDEHPSTTMSMQSLAIVYSLQGRALESEKIGVCLVETRKQTFGDMDPATLTSINHLATVHTRQGRYKEAEEALTYVRNTRTIMLGSRHPDTLISIINLGIVYYHQGKLEDADVLLRHAVEVQKEVLGERHPDTLSTISNLAIILES